MPFMAQKFIVRKQTVKRCNFTWWQITAVHLLNKIRAITGQIQFLSL